MSNIIFGENIDTVDGLKKFQVKINEAIETKIKNLKRIETAKELSNKSFGFIKESFENLSPLLFSEKNGKKVILAYTQLLKESKSLTGMHNLYENIRKTTSDSDVDFFINNITSQNWSVTKKELNEDKKKLGLCLASAYLILGEEADKYLAKENDKLSNAVEFIAENRKNTSNLSKYSEAVKIIRENINNNDKVESVFESKKSLDITAKKLIDEFNEKYGDELNEEEKKLVKEFSSSKNKEELFNNYKNSCITNIEESIKKFTNENDLDSANRLSVVKEQISKKTYIESSLIEDITNLIKISDITK